ncbi:holo-ACP synthase [Thiomicrolovo sp. ZZH C-3]
MIGIDLVKIERIEGLITRHGDRALQRFLSPAEIALVGKPHTAAGFWAAKEACAKALGCGIGGECGFHDIVISKTDRGAPLLTLSESVRTRYGITEASLSITHDGGFAIAVVALETAS